MPFIGRKKSEVRDLRREMIEETNRWLSWAMAEGNELPRIPIRQEDLGGFRQLIRMPGARKLATRWWRRVLDLLPDR